MCTGKRRSGHFIAPVTSGLTMAGIAPRMDCAQSNTYVMKKDFRWESIEKATKGGGI